DFQAVLAVPREMRRPVIAALARCCREDIEQAWQANWTAKNLISFTGASWRWRTIARMWRTITFWTLLGRNPSIVGPRTQPRGYSAGPSRPGPVVHLNPANKDNGATASLTAGVDE